MAINTRAVAALQLNPKQNKPKKKYDNNMGDRGDPTEFSQTAPLEIFRRRSPDDIMLLIFLQVFGNFFSTPRAAIAWSSVYIPLSLRVDRMRARFYRAKERPISVFFDFVDHEFTRNKRWTMKNLSTHINAAFDLLQRRADKCIELSIKSFTLSSSALIIRRIGWLRPGAIRNLSLHFNPYTPDSSTAYRVHNAPAPPPRTVSGVKDIRIQGTMPRWTHGHPYAHLSGVSLHHLRGTNAIRWEDAMALFNNNHNLLGVRLDHVECRGTPSAGNGYLTLPNLVDLHVSVCNANSVLFAASMKTPAISNLQITAKTDVDLIVDCAHADTIRSMLGRAPAIVALEVSNNKFNTLQMLVDIVTKPLPKEAIIKSICPHLTMIIGDAKLDISQINRLLTKRSAAFFDEDIVVYVPDKASNGQAAKEYFCKDGKVDSRYIIRGDAHRTTYFTSHTIEVDPVI
ncbi:hypothetical protein C8R44DRAFT_880839 [Mycena epipterygia]|nr:hypothetical protein C8R44DRAFT_880839 [Mycena epipterygia]